MYRPPSIQTLRALEAAARHRSFSRAAEELGVTHGAISHRIREIEERLGTSMFERQGNSMEPTVAARQLLPVVRQSLELIASVFPPPVDAGQTLLRIGVLPSFAGHWLVPRLNAFHTKHPEIAISLDARLELSTVGPRALDAAIRYGNGDWNGLKARRLMADTLYPACSPEYQNRNSVESEQDFARCHLLRNSWQRWTPWFQKASVSMPEPADSLPYDDSGLMLDAVVAGHGIGLVRKVIAHDAIASGQLVRLSRVELPFDGAYHFVFSPTGTSKDRAMCIFSDWLVSELEKDFSPPIQ